VPDVLPCDCETSPMAGRPSSGVFGGGIGLLVGAKTGWVAESGNWR